MWGYIRVCLRFDFLHFPPHHFHPHHFPPHRQINDFEGCLEGLHVASTRHQAAFGSSLASLEERIEATLGDNVHLSTVLVAKERLVEALSRDKDRLKQRVRSDKFNIAIRYDLFHQGLLPTGYVCLPSYFYALFGASFCSDPRAGR